MQEDLKCNESGNVVWLKNPVKNITEGFKTLCRIPKRKQNKQKKKERKNGENIQNDIVEVTTETTTTKEVYWLSWIL